MSYFQNFSFVVFKNFQAVQQSLRLCDDLKMYVRRFFSEENFLSQKIMNSRVKQENNIFSS